jgi:YbbR domain-containing protein
MKSLLPKIFALLMACVVWFVVSAPRRESKRERIMTASISLVALPSNLVITEDIPVPSNVEVRLRGRMSDLRSINPQSLDAAVDLAGVREAGEVEITLRPQSINVPAEIEVVSVEPNKIRFRIERLRQRVVEIRPYLVGDVPPRYVIGEPTAFPDRARVSGPASQIAKLSEVTTERIIMTGRTETFVQSVAVISDSPLVRVVSPMTTQVTVPVLSEIGPSPLTDTGTAATSTTTSQPEQERP